MVWQAGPNHNPARPRHDTDRPMFPNIARARVRRRVAPTGPTARRRGATAYAETGRAGPTFCRPPPSRAKLGRPDPSLRI